MSIRDLQGFLPDYEPDDSFLSDPAHVRQASLADLSWMDVPSGVVFGQRRQGEPPLDTASTLRADWDKNLPRMGPVIHPPEYSPDLETPKNPGAFQQAVRLASQRLHFGESAEQVLWDLGERLGTERAAAVAPALRADEGLAGKVFIRIAAFPGGLVRWAKVLRKRCPKARYVVDAQERSIRKSEAAGRILRVCASVPWNEAYREYAPGLASLGAPVPAAPADPARALQAAFLWVERGPAGLRSSGPVVAAFMTNRARMAVPTRAEPVAAERPDMRIRRQVEALASREIIDQKTAARLLALPLLREQVVASAVREAVASQARGSAYRGEGVRLAGTSLAPRPAMRPAEPAKKVVARSKAASVNPPAEAARPSTPMRGHVYRTLPVQVPSTQVRQASTVDRIAAQSGQHPADVGAYLRWARTAVARGMAGEALETEMKASWSPALVRACDPVVSEIRAAHEGRAGTEYVYADAHLSSVGDKGCVAEARRLRMAEGVKPQVILASQRCSGCARLADLPGAGPTCLVYGLKVAGGES